MISDGSDHPVSHARADSDQIETGFPGLDSLLGGGLRRGDLVVLGGDVGAGKSALALAVALRSAAARHAVAFLSAEMSPSRIAERGVALATRARLDDVRRRTAVESSPASVDQTLQALGSHVPLLANLPGSGVAGLSEFLSRHSALALLVVDPLQSLATGLRALDEDLAAAARELKDVALRHHVAVLVVSHLARAVRERSDPRPVLEDLGGLGAVRQHADIVLGLFREELYDASPQVEGATELHVLKNRNGPLGFVDLYFYKQWLRFEDVVE